MSSETSGADSIFLKKIDTRRLRKVHSIAPIALSDRNLRRLEVRVQSDPASPVAWGPGTPAKDGQSHALPRDKIRGGLVSEASSRLGNSLIQDGREDAPSRRSRANEAKSALHSPELRQADCCRLSRLPSSRFPMPCIRFTQAANSPLPMTRVTE